MGGQQLTRDLLPAAARVVKAKIFVVYIASEIVGENLIIRI